MYMYLYNKHYASVACQTFLPIPMNFHRSICSYRSSIGILYYYISLEIIFPSFNLLNNQMVAAISQGNTMKMSGLPCLTYKMQYRK